MAYSGSGTYYGPSHSWGTCTRCAHPISEAYPACPVCQKEYYSSDAWSQVQRLSPPCSLNASDAALYAASSAAAVGAGHLACHSPSAELPPPHIAAGQFHGSHASLPVPPCYLMPDQTQFMHPMPPSGPPPSRPPTISISISPSSNLNSNAVAGPSSGGASAPVVRMSIGTAASINLAMQRRHPESNAKFACQICGRTFTRKMNLDSHIFRHTGEKPEKCTSCPMAFPAHKDLVRHMKQHSVAGNTGA